MKILHLTDTHFTRSEDLLQFPDEMVQIFKQQMSFEEKLHILTLLEDLGSFDFVVVTGDLVHECQEETYHAFFEIMKDCFGDVPVYYVTGNHDMNEAFLKARKESYDNHYVDYSFVKNDIHFIILDSSKAGETVGSFSVSQVNRLKNTLAENDLPKFIFLHHPLFGWKETDMYSIQNNQPVIDLLTQYNVLGLFTGHTHQLGIHVYQNLVQHTSYHFGFGINHKDVETVMEINDMTGYSVIEYDEKGILSIRPRLIQPIPKALFRMQRSIH